MNRRQLFRWAALTNSSTEQFAYETKGPHSAWGGPYTLKPGESHEFEIAYPMLYRRRTESGSELHTLPIGSHSEFRIPRTGGAPQLFQARENIPENETPPQEAHR